MALEIAAGADFNPVLMDIQLPGIAGVQTMKRICEIHGSSLLILALTSFAMKGDEKRYLEAGFDDYISKPLDVDAFQAKIKKILSPENK